MSLTKTVRILFVIVSFSLAPTSSAVIVGGGDGTQNTTQPIGLPQWNNVGTVNSASGVYIGNGWVLTAYHVLMNGETPTSFDLGSFGTFGTVSNSAVRLTNPITGTGADLAMFQLSSLPALPSLAIASSNPTNNASMTMIGYGRDRPIDPTYWNASWQPTTQANAVYAGYEWLGSTSKRWGTNNVTLNGGQVTFLASGGVNGDTWSYITRFYEGTADFLARSPTSNEAQAAQYDSGGAAFNTSGELAGIMFGVGSLPGQPESTAVAGNVTFMANLATYQPQIAAIVPEPGAIALALLGLAGMVLMARSRFRRVAV